LLLERGIELLRYALLAVFLVIPACATATRTANTSLSASLREYTRKLGLIFYDAKNSKLCKLALFFFLAFCLYTTVLLYMDGSSLRIVRNWVTFYIIGAGAVYYLGWNAIRYIFLALVIGVLLSFGSLFLHSSFPEVKLFIPTYNESSRLALYMSHPNNLGALLGWGCCLLCYCRLNNIIIINKLIDLALLIAMLALIGLTGSRTGMLASLIIMSGMLFIFRRKHLAKFFIVILCMVALFFTLRYMIIKYIPENNRFISVLNNPIQDSTLQSRLVIWDIALKFIEQKPLTGHGPHSFQTLYNKYVSEHAEELHAKYKGVEPDIRQAHNFVLGLLSDMGAIGLILCLAMLSLWLYATLRCPPPYNLGAFAIMFTLLIGLAEYPLYTTWRAAALFTACGFIFAGRNEHTSRKRTASECKERHLRE
jgi:oligosaccharide repeat unit polymerase